MLVEVALRRLRERDKQREPVAVRLSGVSPYSAHRLGIEIVMSSAPSSRGAILEARSSNGKPDVGEGGLERPCPAWADWWTRFRSRGCR
jgi:hypothetical protein